LAGHRETGDSRRKCPLKRSGTESTAEITERPPPPLHAVSRRTPRFKTRFSKTVHNSISLEIDGQQVPAPLHRCVLNGAR
jgi:hypothetical protein